MQQDEIALDERSSRRSREVLNFKPAFSLNNLNGHMHLTPALLLDFSLATTQSSPNVVVVLIDDLDLERIPIYARTDPLAASQLEVHLQGGGCKHGANCTYTAPAMESVGDRGVRFQGAHAPVSVCTPARYSILTGRLPSSSPFYSGTKKGLSPPQTDVSWNTWIQQGNEGHKLCCGPGVPKPCNPPRLYGCLRQAKTLGSMLQKAGYFTGFVGKWHISPPTSSLKRYHKGTYGVLQVDRKGEEAERVATLNKELAATREELQTYVQRNGFNWTGALAEGNVIDATNLGVGVHNIDWEADAALHFLDTAVEKVTAYYARAFYLHFSTTLTHSPGPKQGICADPRLCLGGLLSQAPSVLPSRESILQRTGGGCGWYEYDTSHTIWLDEAVSALLTRLRLLKQEENTLFMVTADHQRVGKGTLYHGVRIPLLLQWPAKITAGQVFPAEVLVSALDVVPTVLDAAGVLNSFKRGAEVVNAGAPLDGRSLLPLFDQTKNEVAAGKQGTWKEKWDRDSLWFELGMAVSVKHWTGWQVVAMNTPAEQTLVRGGVKGKAEDVVDCSHERLRTGGSVWSTDGMHPYTHTRRCVWRDTGEPLTFNLIGENFIRFNNNDRYPNYHQVEQLVNGAKDNWMQHNWKSRCPRQLQCMQEILRRHALRRVHFDGDAIPFGIYTSSDEDWSIFNSGTCETAVLDLSPDR